MTRNWFNTPAKPPLVSSTPIEIPNQTLLDEHGMR